MSVYPMRFCRPDTKQPGLACQVWRLQDGGRSSEILWALIDHGCLTGRRDQALFYDARPQAVATLTLSARNGVRLLRLLDRAKKHGADGDLSLAPVAAATARYAVSVTVFHNLLLERGYSAQLAALTQYRTLVARTSTARIPVTSGGHHG